MKKLLLLLLIICGSFSASAQDSKAFYAKANYALVPHNILQGVGYTAGYQWHTDKPVSWKVETGMLSTFKERKMNETVGDITFLDLHYNLAQWNLAFIPTLSIISSKKMKLSGGLGLSGAYQSKIFMLSNYKILRFPDTEVWEYASNADASNGLKIGTIAEVDLSFRLNEKWTVSLSSQYHTYLYGEPLLITGIGTSINF